jgi:hypothetical protein
MPSYAVNETAVAHERRLVRGASICWRATGETSSRRQKTRTRFSPTIVERVRRVHLGLTEGASEETKARYAFVYGDFRRLHRTGLIACHYRAAEWRHKEIELAAHELLQIVDRASA